MLVRSLSILHLELGSWKTGAQISKIKKEFFFFSPETCRRQILITTGLSKEQKAKLESHAADLKSKTEDAQAMHGFDAYHFLLRWSVGLLSNKYNRNDHFVLGQLREKWTKLNNRQSINIDTRLAQLMSILFRDAKLIRSQIENNLTKLPDEERIAETIKLCTKTLNERQNGPVSLLPNDLIQHSSKAAEHNKKQKQKILKSKLASLQQQAIKQEHNKAALLSIAKASITAAWQKKQLEQQHKQGNSEPESAERTLHHSSH